MPPKTIELKPIALDTALPFATYQLASTVAEIVQTLQPRPETVLVLGLSTPMHIDGPAPIEMKTYEFIAADWARPEPAPLPYQDGEFACVIACDVVDQLGETIRPKFIAELSRITKQFLVIASPFDSHVVTSAEESVNEIYRSTFGKPNPAVVLHRDQGLPDLRKITDAVSAAMGYVPEVFPNSSIRSWALLQMLSFVATTNAQAEGMFSRLNAFYNARFARVDHAQPAYRHILVTTKGNKPLRPSVVKQLSERFRGSARLLEIETMRDLMRLALDGYAEALAAPRQKTNGLDPVRQIQELERKTRTQARQIEKLNDEIFRLKNEKTPARLLKKLFTT